MRLETKTVVVDGSKIRYLHGGKGKPLLFLHGWPANPATYRHALELLANSFAVYAPYMFDFDCANMREIAHHVNSLIERLGISKVIIIGISFGGAVAGLLSHDKKLVSRLVLINTAGVPREASLARMFVNLVRSSTSLLLRGKIDHFLNRYISSFAFLASLRRTKRRKLFKEIGRSTQTHVCYLFQRISVPTTIIWCTRDDVFPVTNATILQKLISNSKLTVVEADHYWPFHKPEHFAETIVAHVK